MTGSTKIAIVLLAAAAGGALAQPGAPAQPSIGAIATLDVPRYMGDWYEIAKFPNVFQRSCASDTSARYIVMPDGELQVINSCRDENGTLQRAEGRARQVGAGDSAKLKVRFAPSWLSWLPWVWGDYWVVDLDENYQLAAVSEPAGRYLWILSRTPSYDQAAYTGLLQRLQAMGLDTARLERTRHANPDR